jgi:hypothetical protein
MRHAFRRGVGAVRRAERVVDIDVGQRRQRAREYGVVFLLALLKAKIFQKQDFAGTQRRRKLPRVLADNVL